MDVVALLGSLTAFGVSMRSFLALIGVLAGLWLFASAGRALIKPDRGEESPNLGAVAVKLFAGAALIQLSRSIEDTRNGLLAGAGTEVRQMMAYAIPASNGGIWGLVMSTCLVWVATIGCFAVFRGFLLWNKAGSGDSSGGQGDFFWRGLWHILGGSICINMGS